MSSNTNAHIEWETDITLNKIIKAKPILKNSIEKQDSESLNTMDYYKEDSSNKNSLIEEAKTNNQLLYNPINSKEKKEKPEDIEVKKDLSFQLNQANIITNNINQNQNSNSKQKKRNIKLNINANKNQIIHKNINDAHYICSNCNLNTGSSCKNCIKCNNYFCVKCFNGIIRNISENNQEKELKNKNEKICQFCWIKIKNRNNFMSKNLEPLDSLSDDEMRNLMEKSKTNRKNKSLGKMKSLKEQFNIYEEFLNKINDSKNEIEIKKNICMNILQMMKKAVEIEYNKNLNRLNELSLKLNKIKEDLNKKINNPENKYKNEVELQINIDTFKNTLNGFSKIFDNFNQKMISRLFFRGYKLYDSDNISINHSDIYFMQKKELFPELPLWNAFLKIERYTNNFINFLNFSIDIRPKKKALSEPSNNNINFLSEWNNKSRFMVNMIVNNKLIRLNKKTKDNNYIDSSYESSEEEKKLLFSKGNYKIKDFNVKVIISEIML